MDTERLIEILYATAARLLEVNRDKDPEVAKDNGKPKKPPTTTEVRKT